MTLSPGIDISVWQNPTPPLDALDFVFCRAGYGSSSVDLRYAYHANNVRRAGLVLGAYWFWYYGQDNAKAVETMLRVAGDADLWVLDLEGRNANTAAGLAQARDFIARFQATGRRIGLYHSLSGFPQLGQDYDWVAFWSAARPPIPWTFWQYRGSPLDLDYFNGSRADLLRFVGLEPPDTGTDMGLQTDLLNRDDGVFTFDAGRSLIRVSDAGLEPVAAGYVRNTYAKVEIVGGEFGGLHGYLVTHKGQTHVALHRDGTYVRVPDATPYSQADLDRAKSEAAAGATASERKRWTDWKATAPA